MRERLVIFAMVVCFAGSACAPRYALTVSGPKGDSEGSDLAIQELMVRNVIAKEPTREVVLVSFGKTRLDHVDPPAAFFERLTDLDVTLRPVSERDAMATSNALLLVVHGIAMSGETEASVAVTCFRYGVGVMDGFTAAVEWRDGVWRIAKTSRQWST
jgi:hypothetical protein